MTMKIKPCDICGQRFDNVFEMVEHQMDDDGASDFDPTLLLPNGYKLLVGTLLRLIYDRSNKPSQVREVVSSAYMNLYLAETDQQAMRENVENIIVQRFVLDLDKELRMLLEENGDTKEEDK